MARMTKAANRCHVSPEKLDGQKTRKSQQLPEGSPSVQQKRLRYLDSHARESPLHWSSDQLNVLSVPEPCAQILETCERAVIKQQFKLVGARL